MRYSHFVYGARPPYNVYYGKYYLSISYPLSVVCITHAPTPVKGIHHPCTLHYVPACSCVVFFALSLVGAFLFGLNLTPPAPDIGGAGSIRVR